MLQISLTFASMKDSGSFFALIALLLLGSVSFAQSSFPDAGQLYTLDEVPRIYISIHPDSLKEIYDHPENDKEYTADFIFQSSSLLDTITDIGFRLRGNTSRFAQKKSFKISFNTFKKGGKFEGVEKMNLNGEHNDPTSGRAIIYWYILQKTGLAGARANHLQLFINGNYYGLYTNVEHIDEEFAEAYYGNKEGNLYKCLWPADLTYQGSAQEDYKYTNGDHRVYELKTNEKADDYRDLVEFITLLNHSPGNDLVCGLEKVFNVQTFLKIAAIDVMTANWDGYAFNKNNFYLYHNPETDLFEYIPYDVDNTFGIDWFGIDWSNRNMYSWASDESRPLFKRLMLIPEYQAQYTYYIKQVSEIISSNEFNDFIEKLKVKSRPYLLFDPYYPLDYGFTIQSFDNSWESAVGGHIPVGILAFLEQRIIASQNQSLDINPEPVITDISNNEPKIGEDLIITAKVEDDDLNNVVVSYNVSGENAVLEYMYDDGSGDDLFPDDGIYTVSLSDLKPGSVIEYVIFAYDYHLSKAEKPCTPLKYTYPEGVMPVTSVVWPNPVTGNILYIDEEAHVELFDIGGRKLLTPELTDKINISTLESGIYFLKITDRGIFKIIVSH